MLALGLTSGVVFEFGLRQRFAVNELQDLAWGPVVRLTVWVACSAAVLTGFQFFFEQSWAMVRGVTLTVLAIAGGTPAFAALIGVKRAVLITGALGPAEKAQRLRAYLELRSLSLRLLTSLGSLVALTTFALGASKLAQQPDTESVLPVAVVVAFGAVGTTMVGLVYAPPNLALRDEARSLVRALAPLAGKDSAALREELDQREKLERHLGLSISFMGDLQAGIVVLGPLLAASIALLLPSH